MKTRLSSFAILCMIAASACADDAPEWLPVANEKLVVMQVNDSTVTIALDDRIAPKAVKRFQELVQAGFYDDLRFYRVIDGFVVQGGDLDETKETTADKSPITAEFEITRPDDMPFTLAQKQDLFAEQTGFSAGFPVGYDPETKAIWHTHCPGTVALARNNEADSATTEFYIVIGQAPRYLDRNMSVIGRVIDGMPAVQRINRGPSEENGVIKDPQNQTAIQKMQLGSAMDKPPQWLMTNTESGAFATMLDGRKHRKHEFFHFTPPAVLDVCQVPLRAKRLP